ncbi:cysteine--tRNA ligase [Microbulbifer thermotolerans]|uniref:Cysteine--tRNA ligase n=1 Tax=Microbulbifer thermotolerans TaxID=252514 RepID=A0A143HQZ6_MICTH|nr:cysteine--tRNA ligase [Microbulbifer thermotolerans]AMX04155.1 cysteine--tRNA ligase [Microbulbifer thermotolerans]SFB90446.1 cysteinyl-tRNA synthetase [Microbulbifer thermotolerans]
MALQLYNTFSGKKEVFKPLVEDRVRMYVCGPTVYNRVHIGNARPAVVFDTLYRLLKKRFADVVYARNITDIDDKIMKAARDKGEDIGTLSQRYAQAYFEDMAALNNLEPDVVPYATQHLPEMIALIEQLVEKGHAYAAEGHVLFAVETMSDYGKLSKRSLDDMLAGARVEVAPYKKYAGDFVLWKPSREDEPGWDSPWGRGRPGWHLECSAMIKKHLGDTIDIHGGGRDLTFPHHENERAQSCCANGVDFVRYWMHNGYVNIEGEKMSKSLGNFRLVNDLLQQYPGEVLRFALLSAHYRSELNFSSDLLDQAWRSLDSLYGALREAADVKASCEDIEGTAFMAALEDDLNTPVAIGELHQMARALNKASDVEKARWKGMLLGAGQQLGILQQDPEGWFKQARGGAEISEEEIERLIAERAQCKKEKNFARADEIRAELKSKGVVLEDSREGTKWRRE